MSVVLNPYLNFRGQAREAMDFYRSVFGGEVTRMTFTEGGMPVGDDEQNNVMHSQLDVDGLTLMCADLPSSIPGEYASNGTISLSGDDETTLRGYWDKLADGATVGQPLEKAPWGDTFGMLTDRFGVSWLMNISGRSAS
ncbi:VOC family protein [uncultured Jatrophihabitans sp.]|uniref:VOC family protein n=1 Tax=uncultured Jatrophihabitans sp. TaxID=1610747 RepID=UPI0035CB638C